MLGLTPLPPRLQCKLQLQQLRSTSCPQKHNKWWPVDCIHSQFSLSLSASPINSLQPASSPLQCSVHHVIVAYILAK